MSTIQSLKREVKCLRETLSLNHPILRISSSSVDDIQWQVLKDGQEICSVACNITSLYPSAPPMWFSESDDPLIATVIEAVNEVTSKEKPLTAMTRILLKELYKLQDLAAPATIDTLGEDDDESGNDTASDIAIYDDDDDSNDQQDDADEDMDEQDTFDLGEDFYEKEASDEVQEMETIGADNYNVLKRLRNTQREEHLKGVASGSVQATDRLMKELKYIYKSENFKAGLFSVELNDDNLYSWNIKLRGFDDESLLKQDMNKLYKLDGHTDHIMVNFLFTERFPFQAPFVRICYPVITGGYVMGGGAICMELLTSQGWSSAYSVEAITLQITATLVKGKARVNFDENKRVTSLYSLQKAQSSFRSLVKIHESLGWYTPAKDEG